MAPKKRKVVEEAADPLPLPSNAPESNPETLDQLLDPPPEESEADAGDEEVDGGDGDGDDDGDEGDDDGDGDGDERDGDDDIGGLLNPLSREQLISLLRSAAASDPSTLAEIRRVADLDPSQRKLFVHSLGWETTSEALHAAFAGYGEIEDCRVVVDKSSGRSKGYGFVLFRRRIAARRALERPQKLIDGRLTACQLASAGPPSSSAPASNPSPNPNPSFTGKTYPHDNLPRKIYVGNVHHDVDGDRLRSFFESYGEIEEGPLGFDRQTGKAKGFALFVYRTVEGAHKALEDPNKNFEGHLLYCQKATDSNKTKSASFGGSANTAAPTNQNTGGYNGSVYGGTPPEMAAMMGQGILGMGQPFGQGVQQNAAALAAMLAAAGQNTAAFGITPAILASLNPSFAAAMNAGGGAVAPSSGVSPSGPVQGYGMGAMGYQNAGYQGPPGFQGHPAYQGAMQQSVPNQGGGGGSYQGGVMGQGSMARPPMGQMGGYGPH